jgi:hypothetical protein
MDVGVGVQGWHKAVRKQQGGGGGMQPEAQPLSTARMAPVGSGRQPTEEIHGRDIPHRNYTHHVKQWMGVGRGALLEDAGAPEAVV